MTYEELITFAYKHYNEGGDVFVECWSESDFDEYVNRWGEMTEAIAKSFMGMYKNIIYGI